MKISNGAHKFLRGQMFEVRSIQEISAMLDINGKLDGAPFMPEMVKYCAAPARVFRRVNKTCVEGHGTRHMKDTVFLEDLRCDGQMHDDCQRNCLFFWKEAWLKPLREGVEPPAMQPNEKNRSSAGLHWLPTRLGDRYYCQSTELYAATSSLSRWNLSQFLEEIRNCELSIPVFLKIPYRSVLHRIFRFEEVGSLVGSQKKGVRVDLGLKLGDWVKVKQPREIRSTLDSTRRHLWLEFVPSMSEYIGGRYQVEFSVRRIIIEQTGAMIKLNNTVALKGVHCQGLRVKNCPRNNSLYWREAWLDRADVDSVASNPAN